MGWVTDRKDTILEAFSVRRALALPLVVAIVTAAIALGTAVAERMGKPMLGLPPLMWGVLAALGLTIYFFMEYANRLRVQLKPKLGIAFNHDGDGIVKTPTQIFQDGKKIRDDQAIYIRITLNCLSQATVRNCTAFITELAKKKFDASHFENVPLNGAIGLVPSNFDVFPLVPCTVDFLKTGQFDNALTPNIPWPFRLGDPFASPATYRFTIRVNGDGITKTAKVDVTWTGQWDAVTGRMVVD